MNYEQFTKLFKYIEDFRSEVNKRFDDTAGKDAMNRLTNTIDAFVKRLDDADIEQASRDAQFDRLLEWAREVSIKTGIPLKKPINFCKK